MSNWYRDLQKIVESSHLDDGAEVENPSERIPQQLYNLAERMRTAAYGGEDLISKLHEYADELEALIPSLNMLLP